MLEKKGSNVVIFYCRCGCDECVTSSEQDSLRHSQSRINAYRALTSSSLIALSSKDPLLTAFELSWELRRLSRMEQEFRSQYNVLNLTNALLLFLLLLFLLLSLFFPPRVTWTLPNDQRTIEIYILLKFLIICTQYTCNGLLICKRNFRERLR